MNIKTFTIHSVRNLSAFVIALGLGYVAYTVSPSSVEIPKAEAAPTSLSGYAWSDTIGYISFSCTTCGAGNYAVTVDPDNGNFSGHAWSSDIDTAPNPDQGGIGWISFDRSKTGNPPSAPFNGGSGPIAQTDSSGNVTGWARALAGCDNIPADPETTPCVTAGSGPGNASGGWDGWIKLNGVTINPADGRFSGYAWGGADTYKTGDVIPPGYNIGDSKIGGVSVIGWVSFAGAGASWNGSACTGTNDYLGTNRCNYGVKGPTLTSDCRETPGLCTGLTYCQVSSGTCIATDGSCPSGNSNECVAGQQCNGSSQCITTGGSCNPANGNNDCAGGEVCNPNTNTCVPPSGGSCNPANGNNDCVGGQICNTSTSRCQDKPKTRFWQF